MSNYNCIDCNFHTNRKNDYTRHLNSNKHLKKVEQQIAAQSQHSDNTVNAANTKESKNTISTYECNLCHNKFNRLSSFTRHKKACAASDIEIVKSEHMIKEIEMLKKQVQTYENMLKSFTTPQNINYFNYISTHYPNTPALKSQKSYANLLESKKMTLIEVIVMYYNNDQLVSFIGDYIVKAYKKEKPNEQSMWSTDISRLTYIISESCKAKENIWAYDKKGLKIKKIIIEPALQYIKDMLFDFCQKNSYVVDDPEFSQVKAALEIIPLINSGSLADDIAKYIAPEFSVNQADHNGAIIKV